MKTAIHFILLLFLALSAVIASAQVTNAQPSFIIPDTVCVNTPVTITNTSTGATSSFWNFCVADVNTTPAGQNLGNIGNTFSSPVFIDYAFFNNNYYGFLINYNPGSLIRLDFGNSLLNTPTAINLGNFGGIIPPGAGAEGIQIVNNEGSWYAIVVGGYTLSGSTPRILKIDFGSNLTNPAPLATNWGNIGTMSQPIDLHVFKVGINWYGFTVNAENNTITRFNFTNSFNNTPTAVNLGNVGNLAYPTGIYAIDDNGLFRVFIVNGGDNTRSSGAYSLTRLDFGSSLLNTPTGVNLGNPGNMLQHPRDLTIMKMCDQIIGFAVNGHFTNSNIIKVDFNNNLSATPIMTSLGVVGNSSFPHSISKLFRVNNDVYGFVTNVDNNTITRLKFDGCVNSSVPSSTAQNPAPVIYNTPGIYNINLTVDDGLPTQAAFCKQVVVLAAPVHSPTQNSSICSGGTIMIGSSVRPAGYLWNTGATSDSILVNASGIYWVESNRYGCSVRDSFIVTVFEKPQVNTISDTDICENSSVLLQTTSSHTTNFSWQPVTGLSNSTIANPMAMPSTTTQYIVTADNNGICFAKDTIEVTVNLLPIVTVTEDTIICGTGLVYLLATGGVEYNWSPAGTLSSATIANPVAQPNVPTWYKVSVKGSNDCVQRDSVFIDVKPVPVFSVAPAVQNICSGETATMTASGGDQYSWIPSIGISNSSSNRVSVKPPVSGTYKVYIRHLACKLYDSLTTVVNVHSLPVVSITKSNDIGCSQLQSRLNASGGVRYEWSPAAGLSNAFISNPVAHPLKTTTYKVKVASAEDCFAEDSIVLKFSAEGKINMLHIPTAFTPNNDGLNDVYRVSFNDAVEFEFSIYNRWGELVFRTKDPAIGWNGLYKSMPQPGGVFVYFIKAEGVCTGTTTRKGTFVLIR